jgi:hypothetical protein
MRTLLVFALALSLQDKKPEKVWFDDAEKAGPDFKIQGEYKGGGWGAQVVALGDGKFDVYLLEGGLPGDGWNQKTRIKSPAATADGKVAFESKDKAWSGAIGDGKLAAKGPSADLALERVVRKSPNEGLKAPEGATVLFDGTSGEAWDKGNKGVANGLLGTFKSGNLNTKAKFGNVKLHVEFMLSFMPYGRGQGRSNSGVYLAGRHEVQVLDSFGLTGENNECGGLYTVAKPAVNMCFPPLQWQTYDVEYRLATADKGATMSVWHNGVKIHENVEFKGKTTSATNNDPAQSPGPLHLQDHGDPVFYRNLWIQELK